MLDDKMNDQLGLFGAITVKSEASPKVAKREEAGAGVPVETGAEVQADTVHNRAESVELVTSPQIDSTFAAVPASGEKTASLPGRALAVRGRGKASKLPVKTKTVSGLVPAGDVRLTANIREDLHLKLKIAAAHRRTTIGELIEELVESYL